MIHRDLKLENILLESKESKNVTLNFFFVLKMNFDLPDKNN